LFFQPFFFGCEGFAEGAVFDYFDLGFGGGGFFFFVF